MEQPHKNGFRYYVRRFFVIVGGGMFLAGLLSTVAYFAVEIPILQQIGVVMIALGVLIYAAASG